jgi:hypothetical protein
MSNNTFTYISYSGSNPGVWIGSRQGIRTYCNADDGYSFGSSTDNSDNAEFSVVNNNNFMARNPADMILDTDNNNTIIGNYGN